MAIRALIADDHELFRSGMKQLLVDVLGLRDVRKRSPPKRSLSVVIAGFQGGTRCQQDANGLDAPIHDRQVQGCKAIVWGRHGDLCTQGNQKSQRTGVTVLGRRQQGGIAIRLLRPTGDQQRDDLIEAATRSQRHGPRRNR